MQTMKLLLFALIVSLVALIKGQDPGQKPCPFNEQECLCMRDIKHPKQTTVFSYVNCTSLDGTLPKFDALPDAKYNVTGGFNIFGADVSKIPANHFAAFEYIQWLNLNQSRTDPTFQQWDDRAFEGLWVELLEVIRLDGIIPIPKAIKNIGLNALRLQKLSYPIVLADNTFEGIQLYWLHLENVMIESIGEKAFAGSEDTLNTIQIFKADISDFTALGKAISGFKNLININLNGNLIKEIKRGDLSGLPQLTLLDFTNNPITNIEQGAFPSDLTSLRCVTLSGFHMASIDIAPFDDLTKETILPSLSNFNLFLDSSSKLRAINTSVTDKFATLGYVSAKGSNLQTVDPKVGDLIRNTQDFYLDISFNAHLQCDTLGWMSKFKCPDQIFIDATQCADHNQMPLEDYLKSIDPDTECKETHQGGIEFFYC